MTTLALWGLVGWLVLVTGAIVFGHRWESASKRLDADIAFMRAIPSTSPAPAHASGFTRGGRYAQLGDNHRGRAGRRPMMTYRPQTWPKHFTPRTGTTVYTSKPKGGKS